MNTQASIPTTTTNENQIAIVGMGCRFPGDINSVEEFWNSLLNKVDGISDIPSRRWDVRKYFDEDISKPGKMYTRQAGFLKQDLEKYDPLFFGISPREADVIDPMQRLLMEVTWEAFEHAGITLDDLQKIKTGVFVGGFALDNKVIQLDADNQKIINPTSAVGITLALLSNRLSYVFDLTGPSLSIDTACSSSMVATHYAIQSLRNGDCEMAIVGGANTMLTPGYPIAMCKGQFLSHHGRCKAFSDDAAGYVRAEGAGILLLKPLAKAKADGNIIHAVIVESGVNQDGGQTNGISLPNPVAQEALIRKVYGRAGISARDISYVEAHGTGTKAGDPLEINALSRAMDGRALDDICYVGSVKTNIGHMEAGSAVAGIMKAALTARYKRIPPNLHFNKPNANIPFDSIPLKVPTEIVELNKQKTHLVGVNSFGYGGTNGHVLIRSPEADEILPFIRKQEKNRTWLVPISAKSSAALTQMIQRYRDFLQADVAGENQWVMEDVVYSLSQRRTHHQQRAVFVVNSKQDLIDKFTAYLSGNFSDDMVEGKVSAGSAEKLCFVFTGMGPQWWKMGQELYRTEPVFKAEVDKIEAAFLRVNGWSILAEMQKDEADSQMHKTTIAQPANFVIQAALTRLWEYWGVTPDCVIGHSVGEVTSTYIAGAITLDDAVLISCERSKQQQRCANMGGAMLAIGLAEQDALKLIEPFSQVAVAAINSFSAVTLAGDETELKIIAEDLTAKGIFNRFLKVDIAYHSSQMDPILADLSAALASIKPGATGLPLFSTVTGELITGEEIDAEYWCKNVRQSVRFAHGIESVIASGNFHFIEVGPHPVLKTSIKECLDRHAVNGSSIVTTLNRTQPEPLSIYRALAALHCAGGKIFWTEFFPDGGQFIPLPTYAWQREHYWHETEVSMEKRLGRPGYIYMNEKVRAPKPAWQLEVNKYLLPYLQDHQVENMVVFPGAGYIDIALALHHEYFNETSCALEDVTIHKMLAVQAHQVPVIQSSLDSETNEFRIYSTDQAALTQDWSLHASGTVISGIVAAPGDAINISTLKDSLDKELSVEQFYTSLQKRGLAYGYYFRPIRTLYKSADAVLAHIQPVDEVITGTQDYLLHPTILDASFQSLVTLIDGDQPFVPVSLERLNFYRAPRRSCWSYARIVQRKERSMVCEIQLLDEQGNPLLTIENLVCQAINREASQVEKWLYSFEWLSEAAPLASQSISADLQILVLARRDSISSQLINTLDKAAINYAVFYEGEKFQKQGLNEVVVDSAREADINKALGVISYMTVNTVIDLWSTEVLDESQCTTELVTAHSMKLCNLLRGLQTQSQQITWLKFTRGAQSMIMEDGQQNIAISPLLGLGPLVMNEFSNIVFRTIDLDIHEHANDFAYVIAELGDPHKETEVVYRGGTRHKRRVIRQLADLSTHNDITAAGEQAVTARPVIGDISGAWQLMETVRQKPGDKEIEVEVTRAILSDEQWHLSAADNSGLFGATQLAYECEGIVTTAGENTIWQRGDKVTVIAGKEAISRFITLPEEYAIAIPANNTQENYFSPLSYTSALYCLKLIAQITQEDTVLIHGAEREFGLVLAELAHHIGAKVFVSGNPEELRSALPFLPAARLLDIRDLNFVEQLYILNQQQGLQVVINCTGGSNRERVFGVLAEFGHFIDIDTHDSIKHRSIPRKLLKANRRYSSINLDQWLQSKPRQVNQYLQESLKIFAKKSTQIHIPSETFTIQQLDSAREVFAAGKAGKRIYVEFNSQPITVSVEKQQTWFNQHGSYLITGGTSGFGLVIAQWLAAKGVKQLVLVSRSGANADVVAAISALEQQGVKVHIAKADIADPAQVGELFARFDTRENPLRGIFHCAGVLDDGPLTSMTTERFSNVIRPKLAGAWNLHHASLNLQHSELEVFVMFSSVSSMMGNAKQANYVVANSFFDNFAYYRRARGLPSTVINLGALGETGMVARSKTVKDILEDQGISGISNDYTLQQLGNALEQQAVQVGILDIDWNAWFAANANSRNSARYQNLIQTLRSQLDSDSINEFKKSLIGMDATERQVTIEHAIKEKISALLRIPFDQIDSGNSLSDMGVDSLVTSELSTKVKKDLGLNVNSMILLSSPSLTQLAVQLNRMNFAAEAQEKEAEPA